LSLVLEKTPAGLKPTALVENAHSRRLTIHPYTLRRDTLPHGITEKDILQFLKSSHLEGIFTDFPVRLKNPPNTKNTEFCIDGI
jgi:glycerophosphoryl diester phosphodiesterase